MMHSSERLPLCLQFDLARNVIFCNLPMASQLASCYGWRFTEKNTFIEIAAEDGLDHKQLQQ